MPSPASPYPVLVTGGAGYIGSHTVLALIEAGFHPVVVDDLSTGTRSVVPAGVPFYEADVGDADAVGKILSDHNIEAVIHFAGNIVVPESITDPLKYYRNNSGNSLSLIQAAVAHGVSRFVFSSTAAVYGEPAVVPVVEDIALQPINPYGASKLMTEIMLRDVARATPGFRPVRLRYFNVAGADPAGRTGQQGPESTHLIRVATEVALGRRPVLEVYGADYDTRDGTCERDYIHVSDLADVHVGALRYLDAGGKPGAFNCGYGQGYTVLEVVRCLEKVLGRSLPVRMADRRPGDPARLVSDVTKLRTALDWTPAHADLEHIVRTALAWQSRLAGTQQEKTAQAAL
jgi:UDP-glucose 4-epimerase